MEPFEEHAEMLALEAGRLLVAAHGRCQEAHEVARAVGLARRGETWTPCDAAEATAWLAACGAAETTAWLRDGPGDRTSRAR